MQYIHETCFPTPFLVRSPSRCQAAWLLNSIGKRGSASAMPRAFPTNWPKCTARMLHSIKHLHRRILARVRFARLMRRRNDEIQAQHLDRTAGGGAGHTHRPNSSFHLVQENDKTAYRCSRISVRPGTYELCIRRFPSKPYGDKESFLMAIWASGLETFGDDHWR